MIKRLRVENFLSLRDTSIEIEPLTVLVGPNGSGKSAVFKALITLSKLLRGPVRGQKGEFLLTKRSSLDRLVWKGDDSLPIRFHVWYQDVDNLDSYYMLEIRKLTVGWSVTRETLSYKGFEFDSDLDTLEYDTELGGTISWKPPYPGTLAHQVFKYRRDSKAEPQIRPFLNLSEQIGSTWRYRIAAGNIADSVFPFKFKEDWQEIYVGENGYGLPWVLRRLQGENREVFDLIEKNLCKWFPYIEKIEFEEEKNFGVSLMFKTNRSIKPITADMESDGVVQSLFLLWRLFSPESFVTVCLEEPEGGTHPYYLKDRYEFIKNIALKNNRKNYMLATHSPEFLEAIGTEDALRLVRLVEHDSKSGTNCISLGSLNDVEKLFELFKGNLGELWWSGVIGGVPRKK